MTFYEDNSFGLCGLQTFSKQLDLCGAVFFETPFNNIDQFAGGIYFVLKYSSESREKYVLLKEINNVTAMYTMKYSSTRWLSNVEVDFHVVRVMKKSTSMYFYWIRKIFRNKLHH